MMYSKRTIRMDGNQPIAVYRWRGSKQTLFEHTFDGLAANALHGLTPDVSHNASTFFGHSNFKQDGSASGVALGCGMYLPFTPQAGKRYQLECQVRNLNTVAESFTYPAFGYFEGLPSTANDTGTDACGLADPTTVKLSAELRADAATNIVRRGTASSGTSGGGALSSDFSDAALRDENESLDVFVVLDTMQAAYRATVFARFVSATVWVPVTAGHLALLDQSIGAIGFNIGNNSTYRIAYLKLTELTP